MKRFEILSDTTSASRRFFTTRRRVTFRLIPQQTPSAEVDLEKEVQAFKDGVEQIVQQALEFIDPGDRVVHISESDNHVAKEAVKAASNYIEKSPKLGVKLELAEQFVNRGDTEKTLKDVCGQYKNIIKKKTPVFILDTTTTGAASATIKAFTKALTLPTITASLGQSGDLKAWRGLSPAYQQFLIQIIPPADIIPELVRSLVIDRKLSNAAVLYDSSFSIDHKLDTLLRNVPVRSKIESLQEKDIKKHLSNVQNERYYNLFILGTISTINRVLDISEDLGIVSPTYAWHVITQDSTDFKTKIKKSDLIFARPLINKQDQSRITSVYGLRFDQQVVSAFYFDLTVQYVLAIKEMLIEEPSLQRMQNIQCEEYEKKSSPSRNKVNLKKFLQKVEEAKPVFGFIKLRSNGESYMPFKMDIKSSQIKNGISKLTDLGTWNAEFDGNITVTDRKAMDSLTSKKVYTIATVIQQPFVFINKSSPTGFSGYCIDLIEELAKKLEFEFKIYAVQDNKFGNMDDNGKWNGIVRELLDKHADIGLGSMAVMSERENVIDFTVPYYDLVGMTVMMRLNNPSNSLFKFLTVLENDVWFCILSAYFLTSLLLWLFDRVSPYSYQNNREKYIDDDEKRVFTVKESLWFCMTSLTPQGSGEAPKSVSGRLVAATWWLFGFIIIASYTANLAAFLTVSRLEAPIESLEGLSKQYRIQYSTIGDSETARYFNRMADIEERFYEVWKEMSLNESLSNVERSRLAVWDYPISDKYTKLWQAMKETGLLGSLKDVVPKVRADPKKSVSNFAFVGDATDIRYMVMTNCDFRMVGDEFSRRPYALAVQQGSPLKGMLDKEILKLLNKRQLERYKERWWASNPDRVECVKQEDDADGIGMKNIGGVFITIFIGIGFACNTIIIEFYYYKYRKVANVINVQGVPKTNIDNNKNITDDKQEEVKGTQPPPASKFERFKIPRFFSKQKF